MNIATSFLESPLLTILSSGLAVELCSLLKIVLDHRPVSTATQPARSDGGSACDLEKEIELQRKVHDVRGKVVVALVACCHLDRLNATGRLHGKPQFSGLLMHEIVAPLLIRLGWSRSKVGSTVIY